MSENGKFLHINAIGTLRSYAIARQYNSQKFEDDSVFESNIYHSRKQERFPKPPYVNEKTKPVVIPEEIASEEDILKRQEEQLKRFIDIRDNRPSEMTPEWRKYGDKHVNDLAKLQNPRKI